MDRQQAELLSQLRSDAARIAAAHGLNYRDIVAEHPRVKSRYGACYADGLITIRLKHAKTGQPLKYSSLVDTLCHELAHLRHFNHGPKFKAFFLRLLSWARQEGIYRPGPQGHTHIAAPFVPTPEALAAALQPSRRDGVPVFPQSPSAAAPVQGELPWVRRFAELSRPQPGKADPPGPSSQRAAGARAASAARRTDSASPNSPAKRARPEQLSLF